MNAEWVVRPSAFVRECLRAQPDAWQDEVLEAVAQGRQRIALKASKGPGKSTLLAWLGWWFLATRVDPKVVATSVTEANLQDGLWTELAKWQQRSPELRKAFVWGKERITAKQHPETWWCAARTWPKTADPSQQSNTLAGVHADHVLFLIDEAGGIPDAVVATAEAGLANAGQEGREAILVIAGNPTHLSGPLYRACTRERHLWWIREISGDPDDPKRASRVNVQWAREQIEKYGRDDPWVLVNVFGQFPPGQSNALVGVEEATAAAKRELGRRQYENEVKILGVDVARFGDDRSVLFPRQGLAAMKPKVFRHQDTMQLASQVGWLTDKWEPDAIFVDQATFGAGVVDRVKELGYPVIGIDFGGKPGDSKYRNMRAQMWHRMAEWIRAGGAIPNMPELIAELTTPTYDFDEHGKLRVEKKEEVKKRCQVSPDLADALCLTFAAPVAHRSLRHLQDLPGASKRVRHDYNPLDRS